MVTTLPALGATAAVAAGLHPDPTYNAIWVGASTYLALMRPYERETFAKELDKKALPAEVLNSVEFARALKTALETASNTANQEKIKKVARLLRNGAAVGLTNDFDAFKEYARLIDEISPREFRILAIMKHEMEGSGLFGELQPPITREDEAKVSDRRRAQDEMMVTTAAYGEIPQEEMTALEYNWRTARGQIKMELNASNEAIESFMLRLTRTGCVAPVPLQTYESVKTIYRVTPLYTSLEKYIRQQAEDLTESPSSS